MKNYLHTAYQTHRFLFSMMSLVVFFIFGLSSLVVVNGETLEPVDSHVVLLYADGIEYTIPSRVKTVSELLDKASIELGEYDIVEPDTDAAITSDGFRVRVVRARPYVVREGSKELSAMTAHTSARLIAEAAGLSLKPADLAEFAPIESSMTTEIGRIVEVVRSKKITIHLYGTPQEVYTNVTSVSELLLELGIEPAVDDELSPAVTALLSDGSAVYINRNGISVATEEVAISPPIEYIQDTNLSLGSSVTRDPGRVGKRVVTYEIVTQNDSEVSRREISSVIVEQPIAMVVARGRAFSVPENRQELMALAGIPASDYGFADYVIGREGSWCATKWQGQWGYCPPFYEEKFPGAENDTKTGYGICQSTPAIKMASAGSDWRTNVTTQLKWCTSYANSRYGGWEGAYNAWVTRLERDGHGWW